ncbi:hypothetical protein Ocin01_20126 [Orchesella cincta]|uniref:Uncharacterized protein n=1 Tax=Orchesella cincta TaxID=48709 RepID=A0A1D2M0R6_ORCCI|nr:hypothetical protein Ocin01_20126 [Orchesella cincta]
MDVMEDAGAGIPEAAERVMYGDELSGGGLPEIWLNVFAKLDPKDKPAFSGASPVWHDWVESKRTQSLVNEILPLLIEVLPMRNSLESRELCQAWKNPNESLFSNASHFRQPENAFGNSEKVQGFMEEMRGHPGNPFLTRSIDLCYSGQENRGGDRGVLWREYITNVDLLLEEFGSHVHFAEICFNEDEELLAQLNLQGPEIDGLLREWLILLPNVKQLCISGERHSPLADQEIREYYRLNPLPRLEYLETVDLDCAKVPMVDEFLKCGCVPENIKRLRYSHIERYGDRLILPAAVYGFVNLEVLQVPILLPHLKRLASLERRPPLRELTLRFEDGPYFQDVFPVLEVFAETLVQFRASSTIRVRESGEKFTCNLPNLKNLYIGDYWGPPELLFQFKAVTDLEIFRMTDSNGRYVRDLETRMNASNIWMMMPSLQNLTLGLFVTLVRNDGLKWKLTSWNFRSVLMEMVTSTFTDYFSGSLF